MSATIHPTAVVEPDVIIGKGAVIGPHCFIQSGAEIGPECRLASSVWISGFVRLGARNEVHHGTALGGEPQDLKFGGEETFLNIGDDNVIREFVTMNRGTSASGKTVVGSGNLIMAYVHVAHDCRLGDNLVLANAVNMAGHVTIENSAILGGLVPIHQFCRIGAHSMVGTGARIVQDVPPYSLVGADPTRIAGINRIGLKRRRFSAESISALKRAFRYIYRSGLNLSVARERIAEEYSGVEEIRELLEFIEKSERGIILK